MEPSFNLIDQPWIGAVDHQGRLQEYSLRDLLMHAHKLRSLHDDSPLVIASLLRMLLALLHRVYDGPQNRSGWQMLWQTGHFDGEKFERYFTQWYDRFDLFSQSHPFYQTTAEIGKPSPITTLIPEAASGNNATLFDHRTEDNFVPFEPAKTATAVLVAQYFSLGGGQSGIKGRNFTDATLTRGATCVIQGKNLFQTLILNLVPYQSHPLFIALGEAGIPAWEQQNPLVPDRSLPNGLLDYMTWQSRRIKVVPTKVGTVSQVYRSQGLILDRKLDLLDSMKFYKKYSDTLAIVSLQPDRAVWRDTEALFRLQDSFFRPPAAMEWLGILVERRILPKAETLKYLILGMASGQAKVEYYRSEAMPLPSQYMENDRESVDALATALQSADGVASALSYATFFMAWLQLNPDIEQDAQMTSERISSKMSAVLKETRTELKDMSRDEESKKIANLYLSWAAERRYWALLEPLFRQTMQAIPQDSPAAITLWFDWLRQSAWDVFNQVCNGLGDDPRALKATVRGREQLARGLGIVLKIQT
ncbi:MAG: type I-E CRISPR-associated protein Cse1/CasA [Caldilineaceae bacterium]